MKKLIVFSVILVLVASTAFAETSLSGYVVAGATLANGNTVEDSDITASGHHSARLQATAQNDEGTFGGVVRVNSDLGFYYAPSAYAWAWWQPIDQFKLTLGQNPDGLFGVNYIVGWGWHASDAEDVVAFNGYGFTRSAASYAGFGAAGAILTIAPMDALSINIGIPFESGGEALDVYKKVNAQIAFDIESIGQVAVTYEGGVGSKDAEKGKLKPAKDPYTDAPGYWNSDGTVWTYAKDPTDTTGGFLYDGAEGAVANPGAIYAQFYLTAIENLGVNLSFKYTLPTTVTSYGFAAKASAATTGNATTIETTTQAPMAIGLGVQYDMGDFGVKLRGAVTLAGSEEVKTTDDVAKTSKKETTDDPMKFGVDIMPYYDLGILKAFLNAGIEYTAAPKGGDAILGWYVNPIISKSVGGGTFFAGAQIYSNYGLPTKDTPAADIPKCSVLDKVYWAIPIGMTFAF